MNILYFTALDELDREKCGILGKVLGQINALKKSGMEVHYAHFYGSTCLKITNQDVEVEISAKNGNTRERLGSIYPRLLEYIVKNDIKIVYIRFTSLDIKAISFYQELKSRSVKVIIEFYSHNLELEARKTVKRSMENKQYIAAARGYISLLINKYCFSKLQNCIDLIVTTTKVKDLYGVPTINVVNGIDTNTVSVREREFNRYDFNIVSVAMISPWHGYDRVIKGIADYYEKGGKKNILYTVVGDGEEKTNLEKLVNDLKIQDHVEFTGIKIKQELDDYYNKADIALEMLAGFRRTKGNISSIKMAEYFAKGIPVLYAADMMTYTGEMEKYCYWVENTNDSINIFKVIDFCENLYAKDSNVSQNMHNIAEQKFDWEYTMQPLIRYIKSL